MAAFVKLPDLEDRGATDSFDFSQLTSEPTQPDGGTDMSPWTVTHDTNSGDRANPETCDCLELLGQPATETLTNDGFLI